MPKRRIVDSSKLIEAMETGQLDKKIVSKFGFKPAKPSKPQQEDGLERSGRGRYGRKKRTASNEVIKINQRNSLVVPREMVEKLGYVEGDLFYVRKTKSGIHLKKM
ncbi:MAG: hypothetical protein JRI34_04270 [Deltaproteobacteria bacterium]|nr:hypothetical protein [Deltaproteobacteria bacterium]